MPEAAPQEATPSARVVELAGGVGGAKLAQGLQVEVGDRLTVVVNTGDDVERHGLAIWPDHDTVMYALAGLDDRERGWGIRDETWTAMDQLGRLGEETWFRLGDRDLRRHFLGRVRHSPVPPHAPRHAPPLAFRTNPTRTRHARRRGRSPRTDAVVCIFRRG